MHYFGKLIGVLFGTMFGGFLGALIGLYLGHRFDRARARANHPFGGTSGGYRGTASQQQRQSEFFKATFAVMGHVAKSKGQVTRQEIELASNIMQRMRLDPEQTSAAQAAFRDGKESDFPLDEILQKVRTVTAGRYDLLQFFLEVQVSAAFADGSLDPKERAILHTIAQGLGFSAAQLEQRLRMQEAAFRFQQGGFGGHHQGQHQGGQWQQAPSADQLKDAFELIGVSEDADSREVKRAYRKLMNEHHPDKLVAKGLPPEMMEMAKEKAQEIQNAYDLIKKEKGFK
ncbi:molecular chaperone DnaJ [Vibrio sp. qd031]|uniref:co-chaperone DjlA n=1 Tax=Vibrio sp. qd031 TaxID=1603038 RepID=UPI000A120CAA|nr:co-chaperone DjlA [Vibrio sp. qd031]ORT48220.1 molecular chaperone DnaJ [Vibrio sp. qd031]